MLPKILCDNMSSLNPGVERLTFSVFFYMKRDGTVLEDRKPKFCKSIIKSCGKLSYDVVNELVNKEIIHIKEKKDEYK